MSTEPRAFDYIPQPPLADFITSFRFYEQDGGSCGKERILPTGTTELVMNLRHDALRVFDRKTYDLQQSIAGSMICGVHSEFFVIDTSQKSAILTVNFKVGCAFPFLGLPAAELHNECVALDTLWGTAARDLHDRLLEAETPETKFHILEEYLLARLIRSSERHPAVNFALKAFCRAPQRSIVDVTERIGLSSRRFIEVFRREVGLTPKLFCRVQRFQQIVHFLKAGQPVDWTDMALACGYFDQAHFIHDFRAFSGLTPTAYLSQQGEHLNHIPLPDRDQGVKFLQ
jgi:AraC-like DNA-binding protein